MKKIKRITELSSPYNEGWQRAVSIGAAFLVWAALLSIFALLVGVVCYA